MYHCCKRFQKKFEFKNCSCARLHTKVSSEILEAVVEAGPVLNEVYEFLHSGLMYVKELYLFTLVKFVR